MIASQLPVLYMTEGVCFPGATVRISVRSKSNLRLVDECLVENELHRQNVIVMAYKAVKEGGVEGMHRIATAAVVQQVIGWNWPKMSYNLKITGLARVKLDEHIQLLPYPIAKVEKLVDDSGDKSLTNIGSLVESCQKLVASVSASPNVNKLNTAIECENASEMCDLAASILQTKYSTRLAILDAVRVQDRIHITRDAIEKYVKSMHDTKLDVDLRNGIKTPKLRGLTPPNDSNGELLTKIMEAKMPEEVEKMVVKELNRLKSMPSHSIECAGIRNYIEYMVEMPWNKCTPDKSSTIKARVQLDVDHFGLEPVKNRVLEFLATRQLRSSIKGPILCFVGPPGVGKTSIAKSIATTLGRKYHRISLGGVCDQSDIRGHRRTYVGSMPGRIIQGLHRVQSNNPVILLDEIDKMTRGLHGDPASALLEVLDPEQNHEFVDHYVNVPFDLSNVLFVATANSTSHIPAALKDRMEIISMTGYSWLEQVHIAEHQLINKQLKDHGLTPDHMQIPVQSIAFIIDRYTRYEPGVRSLERKIAALCRAMALRVTDMQDEHESKAKLPIIIDQKEIITILGKPVYSSEIGKIIASAGVACGLSVGGGYGRVLYIETSRVGNIDQLVLTGHLGDVIKESATVAVNWVKGHAQELGMKLESGVHVHFPAGGDRKDGPSAGLAIVAAVVSLLSETLIDSHTAITGEISLTGVVLPVGGIKQKLLGAHKWHITRVIIPKDNLKDVDSVPKDILDKLTIIPVSTISEALSQIFSNPQMLSKL